MYKIKLTIQKEDTAKAITTENKQVVTSLDLNGVLLSVKEYAEVKNLIEGIAKLLKA